MNAQMEAIDHNSSILRVRVIRIVISLRELMDTETEDTQPLCPSLCTDYLCKVRSFSFYRQYYQCTGPQCW